LNINDEVKVKNEIDEIKTVILYDLKNKNKKY
jgi:hypothetical protein